MEGLTPGKLRRKLKEQGRQSFGLARIRALEDDESSWLAAAKAMRDHVSHVSGVSRAYFVGGPDHRKVKLRHPASGATVGGHFPETFEAWLAAMRSLVEEIRASAMSPNKAQS